jgi:response regulator RpfG family c-di-GMP phosphodiesterase
LIQEAGKPNAPCVLVVDDEQAVLASLADLLRKEFRVITTDEPSEVGRLLQANDVALLLTDQRMPTMTGAKIIELCSRLSPHTTRILLTAYADIDAVIDAVNEGRVYHYVSKPWQNDRLLAIVRNAVNKSCLERDELSLIEHLSKVVDTSVPVETAAPPVVPHLPQAEQNQILTRTVRTFSEAVSVLERMKAVLPICMYCQQVKTAEGDWQNMLRYLAQNSMILSHGICPDCSRPSARGPAGDSMVGEHE